MHQVLLQNATRGLHLLGRICITMLLTMELVGNAVKNVWLPCLLLHKGMVDEEGIASGGIAPFEVVVFLPFFFFSLSTFFMFLLVHSFSS